MKGFIPALACLLAISVSVQADNVVYRNALAITRIGGGAVTKTSVSGWTIIDALTGDVAFIKAYPARGTFFIERPEDYVLDSAYFDGGRSVLFISVVGSVVGYTARGVTTTTDIGAPTLYRIPRSMTLVGSDVNSDDPENAILIRYEGVLTYDGAGSHNSNALGRTFEQEIQARRQYLISRGYIEEL